MDAVWQFELTITIALQNLGNWLTLPMQLFSFLGQEEFYLLVIPLLYWCFNAQAGLKVGLMLLLSGGLNSVLKIAFHSPRPYWISTQVKALATETSFGVPSGHAMVSSSVWGIFGIHINKRNRWLWVGIAGILFLIGFSRVYLGVHFTSDIIAGWLFGLILIGLFYKYEKPLASWWVNHSLPQQMLIILSSSLIFIILAIGARASLANWTIPDLWLQNTGAAIHPLALSDIFTTSGLWLGLCGGAAWLFHRGGLNTDGPIWQKIIRYLIGLVGIGLLWYGLGAIFPRSETVISYTLRFFRYTLIGIWVSAMAPVLFHRFGLAKKTNQADNISDSRRFV